MKIFDAYREIVAEALTATADREGWVLPDPLPAFTLEPPREASHGDMATNLAMVMAKPLGKAPRVLAEALLVQLQVAPGIASATLAGPGFINLRLKPESWHEELRRILQEGSDYADCKIGKGVKVNVEYVSTNPTGPIHAGHVRGAVIGDCLANLMEKVGYDVTREYYLNDAGAQIDVLGRTTYLRYREALGEDIGPIPEGLYPGEYLREVAEALAARDGDKWRDKPEAEWLKPISTFATERVMETIRRDLDLIGIRHDVFTNERELIANGTLEQAFKILEDMGLIYTGTLPPPRGKVMEDWEPVPLTLFRSSQFGDSTDRPLKKRDGVWAYIMPDIAYHYDKIRRGFALMINVLGKDHGGYLERLRPAVAAFSGGKAQLNVIFNSIVKVFKNGQPVKLSKRSGNLITLREMVEEVGAGAVRFFMMTRTPDSELEFDFAKVVEQSRDNPVFYVQYAHARCCSVIRHASEMFGASTEDSKHLAARSFARLNAEEELLLLKTLANWPRVLAAAAQAQEPHRLTYYLIDAVGHFHALWNRGREQTTLRFLQADDPEISLARLALVQATRLIIADALGVLGVAPLTELRDEQSTAA